MITTLQYFGTGASLATLRGDGSGNLLMDNGTGGDFLPDTPDAINFGRAANRWLGIYAITFYPGAGTVKWTSGAGTPEASLTAPVGSMYTRTDGGAGTTLYVKETGTGNTGWVAK